jgi:hypothetical protein
MAKNDEGRRNKPKQESGTPKRKAVMGRFLKKGSEGHFITPTNKSHGRVVRTRDNRIAVSAEPQAPSIRPEVLIKFDATDEGLKQDATAMNALDMSTLQVKEVDGQAVVEIIAEQFYALLEYIEDLEDAVDALKVKAQIAAGVVEVSDWDDFEAELDALQDSNA